MTFSFERFCANLSSSNIDNRHREMIGIRRKNRQNVVIELSTSSYHSIDFYSPVAISFFLNIITIIRRKRQCQLMSWDDNRKNFLRNFGINLSRFSGRNKRREDLKKIIIFVISLRMEI